jgi:hypothetical protein
VGKGVNTIFRPTNGFPEVGKKDQDNILEINLTLERLQFMEASILKQVKNRGFDDQADIDLTGIPYQQTVSDRLSEKSGKADHDPPIAIHFEQGLLMRTPATTSPPNPATISRLASIPHGTAFTAQDVEPTKMTLGAPAIPNINIMPFPLIGPEPIGIQKGGSRNMTYEGDANKTDKGEAGPVVRIPGDLTDFKKNGVLTVEGIRDPNSFLREANSNKDFAGCWTFTLKSNHPTIRGGGVSNIAFLADGVKPKFKGLASGNANAVEVTCQYWVSIVKHKVEIPADDYTNKDAMGLLPKDDKPDVPGPRFQIQVGKKLTTPKTVDLTSTQIQYSQNVRLDFGNLAWPHVSVATLAPALPILIRSDHVALAGL